MSEAILIDRRANASGLQRYLAKQSAGLANLRVLEKEEALAEPHYCESIKFLFSTWNMPVMSEQELEKAFPSLEALFYAAGDTAYFSASFARRRIPIYTAQAENSLPVAEFVLAQILLANKGYFQAQSLYKHGLWPFGFKRARALSRSKPGNNGATVGIIGLGSIGALTATMLQPFDLQVLGHDPYLSEERFDALGVTRSSLEELFSASDIITNHLPDIEETRGLLSYSHFSSMKPHATFINTGRGRQVDEKGLIRAMGECPSKSALLDVSRREPPIPLSPLYRMKNIFLSPHIAGSQGNEIDRLYQAAFRHYRAFREAERSPLQGVAF
jgi:phosphoglycerate dehydrogenase-like enzyme